jgi:hypothetical protein
VDEFGIEVAVLWSMPANALFPDAPRVMSEDGRHSVPVPWKEAECLRQVLNKRGCPTTLVLNPETREARLELWPGVLPTAVLAVLEARRATRLGGPVPTTVVATGGRDKKVDPGMADATDLICI